MAAAKPVPRLVAAANATATTSILTILAVTTDISRRQVCQQVSCIQLKRHCEMSKVRNYRGAGQPVTLLRWVNVIPELGYILKKGQGTSKEGGRPCQLRIFPSNGHQ